MAIIQKIIEFGAKNLDKILLGLNLFSKGVDKVDKEVKELNNSLSDTTKELQNIEKESKKVESAISKAFNEAEKEGAEYFEKVSDRVSKLIEKSNDWVKSTQAYKKVNESIDNINKTFNSFIKRVDDSIGLSSKLSSILKGIGKVSGFAKAASEATGFNKVLSGIGNVGGKAFGAIGNLGSKAIGGASKAFLGLGKAIAASGVGLLLLIVGKLTEKLLQNEKVVSALNKVFAVLEGVLNPLIDIIVDLGEKLFTAFSKPQETLQKIKDFIEKDIFPIFTDLGNLIKAVFTGNITEAGKIVDKFKEKAVNGFNVIKKAVTDYADKAIASAKANLELQKSIEANDKALRALVKAEGEISKVLEKSKAAVEDGTASYESRLAALKIVQDAEKKLADNQIAQQKLILDNLVKEAAIKKDESKETQDAIAAQQKAVADAEAAKIATINASTQQEKDLRLEKTSFEIDLAQQTAESLADTEARKAERADLTIEQSLEASKKSFEILDKFVQDSKAKLDASIPEQAAKIAELDALYATAEQDRLDRDKGIEERRTAIVEQSNADRLESAQKRYDEEAAATEELLADQDKIIEKSKTIAQVEASRKAGVDAINTSYDTQQAALDENYATQIKIQEELVAQLSAKQNLTDEEKQQLEKAKKNIETLKGDYKKATDDIQKKQVESLDAFNKGAADKTKELRDKAFADVQSYGQAASQVLSSAFQGVDAIFQAQIAGLEKASETAKQKIAELDTLQQDSLNKQQELQDKLATAKGGNQDKILRQLEQERRKNAQIAKQKADEQKKLEENEKKIKAAKKKAAIAQKVAAITQNVINTALAITALLASTPPTPANIALSIAAGVTGAINTAIIAAQPIPEFAEGGFTSKGSKYQPAGVVHAGEWVAPKWMVDSPQYSSKIGELEAIRSGSSSATVTNGYANGGLVTAKATEFGDDFNRTLSIISDKLTQLQGLQKVNNELTVDSNEFLDVIAQKNLSIDVNRITEEQNKINRIQNLARF